MFETFVLPNQLCGGGNTNSFERIGVLSHSLFFFSRDSCHSGRRI